MLKTRQPGAADWTLVCVAVPGDREVDMKRLEASLEPAEVALLDEADFAKNPFLVKGYIGPKALQDNGVRYLADPRIVPGTAWVTGADKVDHHVIDLLAGRDFTPDGTIEAAEVREGDASPDGHGTLVAARGIEIGHIFQLGRKYTDAFEVDALGPDSKPIRITMGSYGVGVSRLVGVLAEQNHDGLGLIWPRVVSPFDVHIVIAGKDETVAAGAEKIAAELDAAGLEIILDDRKATPGVKFADAELVGVPTILVVGRGLANGVVEVKDRRSGEREEIAVDAIVEHLVKLVRS
jgi:prolyl-tRNA synthetase